MAVLSPVEEPPMKPSKLSYVNYNLVLIQHGPFLLVKRPSLQQIEVLMQVQELI